MKPVYVMGDYTILFWNIPKQDCIIIETKLFYAQLIL